MQAGARNRDRFEQLVSCGCRPCSFPYLAIYIQTFMNVICAEKMQGSFELAGCRSRDNCPAMLGMVVFESGIRIDFSTQEKRLDLLLVLEVRSLGDALFRVGQQ